MQCQFWTLKTAKSRITEQEIQMKDLKFKNNLLEDRLKTVENLEKQQIYNEYFPSSSSSCKATHRACCSHNACVAQSMPNCSNSTSVSFSLLDRGKIDQIVSELLEQKTLLSSLLIKLNSLSSYGVNAVQVPHSSASNTSHTQVSPEAQIVKDLFSQVNHDTSVASIDSVVLDINSMDHLNSKQMTIQLK